jgi:hypothetical protein
MRRALCAAALLAATSAWAGRPLSVEDASIVEEKGCQLEAWVDRSHESTRAWAVPACNFGFDTEWQAGFARTRFDGESRFSEAYVQAKAILRPMTEAEPWGTGLVLGVIRRPLGERHGWDHPYLIGIFTQGLCHAPVLFHFNVGWSHDPDAQRNLTVWGAAVEGRVSERVALLAEAFGANSNKPFLRAGLRWTAVPGHLDFDLSWVARPGGTRDERLVSIGFTWQPGAILP